MRMLRRPIAFLLLVWFLPACSTCRTTDLAPQQAIAGQKAVKVMLADGGSEVTVKEAWVRADSIGGVTSFDANWSAPLSSVVEVKTKKFNAALTVGVVVAGLGVALLIFGAAVDRYGRG